MRSKHALTGQYRSEFCRSFSPARDGNFLARRHAANQGRQSVGCAYAHECALARPRGSCEVRTERLGSSLDATTQRRGSQSTVSYPIYSVYAGDRQFSHVNHRLWTGSCCRLQLTVPQRSVSTWTWSGNRFRACLVMAIRRPARTEVLHRRQSCPFMARSPGRSMKRWI